MPEYRLLRFALPKIRDPVWGLFLRPIRRLEPRPVGERGVSVDYTSQNRWVAKSSTEAARVAQKRKANAPKSWRRDKIYIKVRGEWVYLHRTEDRRG